ncbi:MAG: MFS transporter, partial [SAR202 cluster bacterium]|nr:MFS transporter [SAR202 cluster bacterium]
DKKRLAIYLFSISIAIGPLLLILRLADVWWGISILPPNGEKFGALWWIMLTHSFVQASVGVLAWILVASMTADIVEDSQRLTGKRSEGLFFAGPHLAQKAVSGIGLMIKGVMLTAVGFAATNSVEEKFAAMEDLAGIIVVLSIIMPSICLVLLSRYELTKTSHQSNLTDLGYVKAEDVQPE